MSRHTFLAIKSWLFKLVNAVAAIFDFVTEKNTVKKLIPALDVHVGVRA